MGNKLSQLTVRWPTISAAIAGIALGLTLAYGLALITLPSIEIDDVCRRQADLAPMLCLMVNSQPLPMFMGALLSWVACDSAKRWAQQHWPLKHDVVMIVMVITAITAVVVMYAAT